MKFFEFLKNLFKQRSVAAPTSLEKNANSIATTTNILNINIINLSNKNFAFKVN